MSGLAALIIALSAFVAMEPVTAATHRWVMHGFGARLHRSHHRRNLGGWETNDWYPVIFAGIVIVGFTVGLNVPAFNAIVPAAIGVTLYGAAYALVHDVYIHRRLGWFGNRQISLLDRLAAAHRIHHRHGGAPYGMLCPVAGGTDQGRC